MAGYLSREVVCSSMDGRRRTRHENHEYNWFGQILAADWFTQSVIYFVYRVM